MVKPKTPRDTVLAATFVAESRRRLQDEYLAKLRTALRGMAPADLWWRPYPNANSIANLLLHLDGNVRQWILAGVGGARDQRDRDAEFAARSGDTGRVLLARLTHTLASVDRVLAQLGPNELLEQRTIQGYRVTVLQAVYHVVEHFSGHTGQILYIVQQRRRRRLGLYPHLEPVRRAAPGRPKARRRFL
jgi:uncharacterized damage-inducible protein DinB